ncbi:MAG: Gfo/Idh/MocA family oxidoreductase [Candidatus Aminicenantes bacterium]|nr:Gfo/Idh/MocA family oxidoreductase [Candidatus Aminicenantes bacterium]
MSRKEQSPVIPTDSAQRAGIIGLGRRGLIQAVLSGLNPKVKVTALYDPDERFIPLFEDSPVKSIFYSDLPVMLKTAELDVIFICSEKEAHLSAVQECLTGNIRIYVDTPPAESLDSMTKMANAGAGTDGPHVLGCVYPYKAVFKEAKRLLDGGILEKIKRFRASLYVTRSPFTQKNRQQRGILINTGFPLVHLLHWYFGPPAYVYSRMSQENKNPEKSVSLLINYDTGLLGLVDMSWNRPGYPKPTAALTIEGTRGIMEVSEESLKLFLYRSFGHFNKGWTTLCLTDLDSTEPVFYCEEGLYAAHQNFISADPAIFNNKITWQDGCDVMRTIQAAYLSAESGRPFAFNEVR